VEKVNLFGVENTGRIDIGAAVGSKGTTMYLYDIEPGASSAPYHYEFEEEWLLVVDGTVAVRVPDGELTLERGDLVCFPPGAPGAHKVANRTESRARIVFFSKAAASASAIYPDSNKIGVWTGDEENDLIFRRDTAVPWADGEEGWNRAD
jgi:uncharacterized cupin superfamily protein